MSEANKGTPADEYRESSQYWQKKWDEQVSITAALRSEIITTREVMRALINLTPPIPDGHRLYHSALANAEAVLK